jgi:integrase
MSIYNEYLKFMEKLRGKEYSQSTIIKYRNTKLRLGQYLKKNYKRTDIYLYELNYEFIQNWEVFLRTQFDNSNTTCYKHYQRFTRVVRWAMKKGFLDKYPFNEYRIKLGKKKVEFLTMDEINLIDERDFQVERLNVIADIFVFCCYSGLPYTEVANIAPENIIQGIDGEPWLDIVRQKTKKDYQVPLLPRALEILEKYKNNPVCLKKGKLLPVPSNVKYNAYLKEIATICGIHKHLTTHLARKSFSVSVMLGNGVNVGVLSKTLGHSSLRVTIDAYSNILDKLLIQDINMVRQKLKSEK